MLVVGPYIRDLTCHLTDTSLPVGKRLKEPLKNPTPLSFLKVVLVPSPAKPSRIVLPLPQFVVRSYLEDNSHSLHGLKIKLTHFLQEKKKKIRFF